MHAVGYRANLPVSDPDALLDLDLPDPVPGPHDLLVRVHAVSVNPADVQMRARSHPGHEPRVLGFDAAGVVAGIGAQVTRFQPGDEIYYAGSMHRSGSNAELHLVDEHIVGHKPRSLTMSQAAAMPLTTITAWEALFDHLRLDEASQGTLLVVGAPGGVGSMITQLARKRTGLTVIGTASRPESATWVRDMGAHTVVNHRLGLADQVLAAAPDGVGYVFSPYSAHNVEEYAKLLTPRGHIVSIDDVHNIMPLKMKSITWHWELMFTRPIYESADDYQHRLLEAAAALIDAGTLRTTMTRQLGPLNAATLREAHRLVESGATIGKLVVTVAD
jgi:NADPH2:quinone reductase